MNTTKKSRFSKYIIWGVLLLNIVFTVSVLYVFLKVGNEPVTLIGCWFAFTTGELWMLATIKKTKLKRGGINNESNQLETKINE